MAPKFRDGDTVASVGPFYTSAALRKLMASSSMENGYHTRTRLWPMVGIQRSITLDKADLVKLPSSVPSLLECKTTPPSSHLEPG